ncbi:hypothetical protein FACS1894188_08390 [Clostridia bacterium]|nr:hypothetical protein FACS1894188_08390 [Clostridia bacterium]
MEVAAVIFSTLICPYIKFACHECGKKMYNSRQKATHYTERRFGKEYQHKVADFYTCSTNSLSKVALSAIQGVCGYVRENETEFVTKICEESVIQQQETAKDSKRKLSKNQRRIAELDRLFKKIYEDNASKKLSDKRFEQLSADYEREQAELEEQNELLTDQITAFNEDSEKSSRFIELVRRYTQFDELTTPMLNSFISKIVVHEADKSSGERVQEVDVYFNFIGKFTPPQEEHIPTEEELAESEKRRQANRSRGSWNAAKFRPLT